MMEERSEKYESRRLEELKGKFEDLREDPSGIQLVTCSGLCRCHWLFLPSIQL